MQSFACSIALGHGAPLAQRVAARILSHRQGWRKGTELPSTVVAETQHADRALLLTLLPTAPARAQSWLGDSPKLISCWTQDVHPLHASLSKKDAIWFKREIRAHLRSGGWESAVHGRRALILLLLCPAKGYPPESRPETAPALPEWREAESSPRRYDPESCRRCRLPSPTSSSSIKEQHVFLLASILLSPAPSRAAVPSLPSRDGSVAVPSSQPPGARLPLAACRRLQ